MARSNKVAFVCLLAVLACLVASADAARGNGNGNAKVMFSDLLFGDAPKAAPAAPEMQTQDSSKAAGAQAAPAEQKQQAPSSLDSYISDSILGVSSPATGYKQHEEKEYNKHEEKRYSKDEYEHDVPYTKEDFLPGHFPKEQKDEPRYYERYSKYEEYEPRTRDNEHYGDKRYKEGQYGYRGEEDEHYKYSREEDEHYKYSREEDEHYGYRKEEEDEQYSYGPKRTSICLMETDRVNTETDDITTATDSKFRCCEAGDNPLACNKEYDYGNGENGDDFADEILGATMPVAHCQFRPINSTACDGATEAERCDPVAVNCTISSAAKDCGCIYPGGISIVAQGAAKLYDVLTCGNNTLKGRDGLNSTKAGMFRGAIKYIHTREGYKEVKGDVQFVFGVQTEEDEGDYGRSSPFYHNKAQKQLGSRQQPRRATPIPHPAKKPNTHAPVNTKKPNTHAPVATKKPAVPPTKAPVNAKKPANPAPVETKKPATPVPVETKKPATPAPVETKKPATPAPVETKKPAAPVTPAPVETKKPAAPVTPAPVDAKKPAQTPAKSGKLNEAGASTAHHGGEHDEHAEVGIAAADYSRRSDDGYDPSHYYPYIVKAKQLTINFIEGAYDSYEHSGGREYDSGSREYHSGEY